MEEILLTPMELLEKSLENLSSVLLKNDSSGSSSAHRPLVALVVDRLHSVLFELPTEDKQADAQETGFNLCRATLDRKSNQVKNLRLCTCTYFYV